jgi:hypothetical protein
MSEEKKPAMQQAQGLLNQVGVEVDTAVKVLILAVAFGVIGAIIDKVLELPTKSLYIEFGFWAAILNGPTYAFFKGKLDLAGVVMSAVAGFVGLLVWWIVIKIIWDYSIADFYTIPEVLLTGVIAGLIGFGWYALLERLRPLKIMR